MNRRLGVGLAITGLFGLLPLFQNFTPTTRDCSAAKIAEVLAPSTDTAKTVGVQCNLTLKSTDRVSKRIIIEGARASGITVDCGGAVLEGGEVNPAQSTDMIQVRSRKEVDAASGQVSWSVPENVTVKNCNVHGAVRIMGMSKNAGGDDMYASSRRLGHTERVQASAPRDITLKKLHITGAGRIPLYLAAGVMRVSLRDSIIDGYSESVAIYLDAESAENTIRANRIHPQVSRELIAIDGSSRNKIIGNSLSGLGLGGIFLYRNCGEVGVVRHQSPTANQIINNSFYYNTSRGNHPSVWVASRNGNRNYCGDDNGYPFGSSSNNNDLVRDTVIAQNQIYKLPTDLMIRVSDEPQHVFANETVTEVVRRPSGCYLADENRFMRDGETSFFSFATGSPACRNEKLLCSDGELVPVQASCPRLQTVSFECSVSGNNNGCSTQAACPFGMHVMLTKAACNLESASVPTLALDSLGWNQLSALRGSDYEWEGNCQVGSASISSGKADLSALVGAKGFAASCREHDKNGGDCKVRGRVLCVPD